MTATGRSVAETRRHRSPAGAARLDEPQLIPPTPALPACVARQRAPEPRGLGQSSVATPGLRPRALLDRGAGLGRRPASDHQAAPSRTACVSPGSPGGAPGRGSAGVTASRRARVDLVAVRSCGPLERLQQQSMGAQAARRAGAPGPSRRRVGEPERSSGSGSRSIGSEHLGVDRVGHWPAAVGRSARPGPRAAGRQNSSLPTSSARASRRRGSRQARAAARPSARRSAWRRRSARRQRKVSGSSSRL